jgi:hypothetical protein
LLFDDAVQELHRALIVLRRLRKRVQDRKPDAVEVRALARQQLGDGVLLAPELFRRHCPVPLQVDEHARELLLLGRLRRRGRHRRLGQGLERRSRGRWRDYRGRCLRDGRRHDCLRRRRLDRGLRRWRGAAAGAAGAGRSTGAATTGAGGGGVAHPVTIPTTTEASANPTRELIRPPPF